MEITDNELDLTNFDRIDDIERRIESNPDPKIFTWYINFQFWKPGPFIIIIFWICTVITGIFYGFQVLNLTVMDFDAPPGTAGAIADDKMMQEFQSREISEQLLLYYSCSTCTAANSIEFISNSNNGTEIMLTMSNNFQQWLTFQVPFISYSDYYTTADMYNGTNGNMTMLADLLFISDSKASAVGIIIFDSTKGETEENNFLDNVHAKCNEISHVYGAGKIKVAMTGADVLMKDMTEQSKIDVGINCLLLVPVALCVLALVIRSWRLMLIPVACFSISICASFSILRPFAEHVMDVSPFCPAIMMAATIAMSIDYSLFLLSRFVEEIERKGHAVTKQTMTSITHEAVRQSTRWSGKVIALSGCILSLTFFGLIFYPLNLLQSVGLGCGLAIICTILVNLTCIPSLILIFPVFFSKFGWARCPCEKITICKKKKLSMHMADQPLIINEGSISDSQKMNINDDERINNPFAELQFDLQVAATPNKCEKCWNGYTSFITKCPWSILIIVLVYAAIAPISYQFLSFKQQLSDKLIFPRNSIYLQTYNDISNDFSAGFLAPWNILIFAKNGEKVYANPLEQGANMKYLTETGLIMNETIFKCYENGYYLSIEGIGYIGGASDKIINISYLKPNNNSAGVYGIALNAMTQSGLYGDASMNGYKQVYEFMIDGKISTNKTSSYYSMTTQFDPFYENAIDFVSDFRDYLSAACNKYNFTDLCYFTGGSVGEVDVVHEIFSNFAWIISIIVGTVFCLMGCVFKSIFVPVRLVLTIAIPMSFVYGLSVMVYQNGLLSFLNISSLSSQGDGLFWLIPVMTLTILIGLALDYDIFLFARIYEYRVIAQISTTEAIIRGLNKTAKIITCAGLIMAISFAGLIFSQITALCQTGFILVIGVLVDTFIIRTVAVPAILSIAKEINWWPGIKFKRSDRKQSVDALTFQLDDSVTGHTEIQQMQNIINDVDETM